MGKVFKIGGTAIIVLCLLSRVDIEKKERLLLHKGGIEYLCEQPIDDLLRDILSEHKIKPYSNQYLHNLRNVSGQNIPNYSIRVEKIQGVTLVKFSKMRSGLIVSIEEELPAEFSSLYSFKISKKWVKDGYFIYFYTI